MEAALLRSLPALFTAFVARYRIAFYLETNAPRPKHRPESLLSYLAIAVIAARSAIQENAIQRKWAGGQAVERERVCMLQHRQRGIEVV